MLQNKQPILSTEGIEETLGRWREDVKGKKRGIFSFEDRVKIRLADLKPRMYPLVCAISPWQVRECLYHNVGEYEYLDEDWREIDVGGTWGGEGRSAFFRNEITIPKEMKGKPVVLQLYLGGDSLLSLNGVPYQGLDPFRNTVLLTECAEGSEYYKVEVESYFMWHAGESDIKTLECSCISTLDREIEAAYWDYKSVYNALFMPDTDETLICFLRDALQEALAYIDLDEPNEEEFRRLLEKGRQILRERVFENPNYHIEGDLDLIGHSHLDLVFLWDYAEFVRKAGRTHATMLRLLEQYPNFVFSQSQPVMYEELRKNFPELFEQIRQRVKEGRWEPIGAMWCEPDCNLTSGESLVRQILFGTAYYERWFGITPHTCWLPDVFGNSFGMPQILEKSGIRYFVTHKMNIWNDTNPWQYHSFWWEGPDGSRVFGVVPPTHFIGTMEADNLRAHWNKFSEKETVGESIYCYGWGDGGGGVDSEMLEYAKRYHHFPGLPDTHPAKVEDALARMRAKAHDLTVWKDELYLEAHRGVGTTKGMLKKCNRRAENLYRAIELFSSAAEQFGGQYPTEKLHDGWEKILTAQFHDSLPGSHITSVYTDLLSAYQDIFNWGEEMLNKAFTVLESHISREESLGKPFVVWNSIGAQSSSIAVLPEIGQEIYSSDGKLIPSQELKRLDGTCGTEFVAEAVPPTGFKVYYAKPTALQSTKISYPKQGAVIENNRFRVTFDKAAEITSIFDKLMEREVLQEGSKGNRFRMYEDRPGKYEAWDIVATYVDHEINLADGHIESIEEGATSIVVTLIKPLLGSLLKQRVILYRDLDRIDFETLVDWKERRKLLKVEFDVEIASRIFTSDIAYATIERSNCRYSTYDKAKFEVSAHNFIDLSDDDYGVSLLNDCKYGHEVDGKRMMLSLLKGPMNPDPQSDIGTHTFTYSLYPHAENWKRANTLLRGLELNNPLMVRVFNDQSICDDAPDSLVSISAPNVTLEALKRCEDGNGYLVRICEKFGRATDLDIHFWKQLRNAQSCNLIEREEQEYPVDGDSLHVKLKPYEVKSFKVQF